MILARIFFVFVKIGSFAIGGAYSFLPLIDVEIVKKYGWLTEKEFLDISGLSAVIPGPISVKYATYIGYKVYGIPGAIAANIGVILPAALMMTGITMLYLKYREIQRVKSALAIVRLAVFSMIIVVAFQMIGVKNLFSLKNGIMAIVFLLFFLSGRVHPALIIISAGLLGALAG
ncbi:MAG: chromate transporter [Elusimicrobiota bacterium]